MNEFLTCKNLVGVDDFGRSIECESFSVNRGDFVAIVGDSSSGKEVLLRLFAGLCPFKTGTLLLNGVNFSEATYEEIQNIRVRSGYVFSLGALISNLTIFDNIALPIRYHYKKFAKKYGVKRINRWLEKFGISEFKNLRPALVTMDACKRALFCRAMTMHPTGVFYEEPFIGLGIRSRKFIKDFLIKLHVKQQIPAVMSVSDIDMIFDICTKFIIMHQGQIYKILANNELESAIKEDKLIADLFADARSSVCF